MLLQEFESGLMTFAEQYVVPGLDNGFDRWLFYFSLGEKYVRLDNLLRGYMPAMQMLGFMDPDGSINLAELERSGKAAFAKQNKIKIWKFTFSEPDFDALMAHLRGNNQVSVASV